MEDDILPVIKAWTDRKKDIYSLRFFTPYVLKARDARLEREKPLAPMDERVRAARIAFVTRRVGRRIPREEAWLHAWEMKHGPIELQPSIKEAI